MSHTCGWRLSDKVPPQIRPISATRITGGRVDAGTIPAKAHKINRKKQRTKRR